VVGRVGVEGGKFFGVVGRSVVFFPGPADRELMKAQHVHDADAGEGGAEEVGALGHAGTDEEASVAAALNGEVFGGGVSVRNEPFG